MNRTRRNFLKTVATAVPALGLLGRVARAEPITRFRFVARDDWKASMRPRPSRMARAKGFDRLTIHHWGIDAGGMDASFRAMTRRVDGVLVSHMSRGYGDIGYHFLIDPAGRVWEGRPLLYEGAHVAHENERNIGVMLLGNFQTERPSGPQLGAVGLLVEELSDRYDINRRHVYGHCDLASSLCPGRTLYPYVRSLRGKVKP